MASKPHTQLEMLLQASVAHLSPHYQGTALAHGEGTWHRLFWPSAGQPYVIEVFFPLNFLQTEKLRFKENKCFVQGPTGIGDLSQS